MARIVEPQPGHALLSPHHAELNEEYATTQLREGIHNASGSHAVTIVAACCIGFLLLMVVVGAARMRGTALICLFTFPMELTARLNRFTGYTCSCNRFCDAHPINRLMGGLTLAQRDYWQCA